MTQQQIAKRAKWQMIAAGLLGFISFGGSMVLAANGRIGFAWVWIAFGLVNVYLYWTNLRIYRSVNA